MSSAALVPRRLARLRRHPLAMTLVAVVAAGSLTACGSGNSVGQDTTCGDFASMSAGDRRSVLDDLADASDADGADAFVTKSDADKDMLATVLATTCEGQDPETALEDIQ